MKLPELLDDIYQSTLRMSGLMEQVLLLGASNPAGPVSRGCRWTCRLVARIGD